MEKRRLSGAQIVAIVFAVCGAMVLAPVGVMAATGQLVNIADPVTGSNQARVNSGGGLHTSQVDPSTRSVARVDGGKVRVGDGSGNLTVDGAVLARDMDVNKLVYSSPPGGFDCPTGSMYGTPVPLDLSRYSKIRIAVHSGPTQTVLHLKARSGNEEIAMSYFSLTTPYHGSGDSFRHAVVDAPAPNTTMYLDFCTDAKIYVYGIR